MKTIYKFPFEVEDVIRIDMPEDAKILSLQMQNGVPCLWAEVQTANPFVTRTFQLFGTGHRVPEKLGPFVGTFQTHGGSLVFHLYES